MATKTFKIGEYAVGGKIKVDIDGKLIQIKALDWDTNVMVRSGTCQADQENAEILMDDFLNDITSCFYADKVMTWIRTKIKL